MVPGLFVFVLHDIYVFVVRNLSLYALNRLCVFVCVSSDTSQIYICKSLSWFLSVVS